MKKLYFANIPTILSTVAILGFIFFFAYAVSHNQAITHWGRWLLLMLPFGLAMSILSGIKDKTGTSDALFPTKTFVFKATSVLGIAAFVVGLLALFIRKEGFWQFGFYAISIIIIIKTLVVEVARIAHSGHYANKPMITLKRQH